MELAEIPGVPAEARNLWDYVFRAMADEGISETTQRRIKDRVLFGNPNGPTGRMRIHGPDMIETNIGPLSPADMLERMHTLRKTGGGP